MPAVRVVFIAQDPYKKPIYSHYASAFAYDKPRHPLLSPSIKLLFESMTFDHPRLSGRLDDFEEMLNTGFILLKNGVMFINASYSWRDRDAAKVREISFGVAMMRELIMTRDDWRQQKVELVSFGSIAQEFCSMLASSLSKDITIRVSRVKHPAALARMSMYERQMCKYLDNTHVTGLLVMCLNNYVGLKSVYNYSNMDAQQYLAAVRSVKANLDDEGDRILKILRNLPRDDPTITSLIEVQERLLRMTTDTLDAFVTSSSVAVETNTSRAVPVKPLTEQARVNPSPSPSTPSSNPRRMSNTAPRFEDDEDDAVSNLSESASTLAIRAASGGAQRTPSKAPVFEEEE